MSPCIFLLVAKLGSRTPNGHLIMFIHLNQKKKKLEKHLVHMPFWPFFFFHGSSEKNHLMATNVFPIFFLLFQVEWKTHLVATRHFPPKLCGKSHGGHRMFPPQPLWEITWRLMNVDKSCNGHYIINLGSNEMFLVANLYFFIWP